MTVIPDSATLCDCSVKRGSPPMEGRNQSFGPKGWLDCERCHGAGWYTEDMSRWEPFSDEEIVEVWDGLTMDDGIRYGIEKDDPTYPMVRELEAELRGRGLWKDVYEGTT